ncbi:MAG: hypothetical protein IKJ43_00150 [Bacilli bacterium]|nr:hypothetical protein [Bacilli bacterium]
MFVGKKDTEITDIKHLSFSYSTGTMMNASVSYTLDFDDKYVAKIKPNGVSEEDATLIDFKNEDVMKILDVFKKYQVQKWDGFKKYDKNVLDGNSFYFSVTFKDGEISADGYMMYPKNYIEVKNELDNIFLNYVKNS